MLEYLVEVGPALKEYERSHEIDPSLGADKEAQRLRDNIGNCQKALVYKVDKNHVGSTESQTTREESEVYQNWLQKRLDVWPNGA